MPPIHDVTGDKLGTHSFTCRRCRKPKVHRSSCTTGYALDSQKRKICYACCGEQDKKYMIRHGRVDLYLTKDRKERWQVTNWPGTLRFLPHSVAEGRHNLAGIRHDVWFRDHTNRLWHGVQLGRWNDILRAKRLKQ